MPAPGGHEPAGACGGSELPHVHEPPLVHVGGGGHQEVEGDHGGGQPQHLLVRPLVQVIAAAAVGYVGYNLGALIDYISRY